MIMLSISMDGTLHSPMYMLISEPKGSFPKKVYEAPNIKTYASKTANMNKENLSTFYNEVFWKQVESDKIMLLLDSWLYNKDEDLFNQCKPTSKEVNHRMIPGGGTKYVQPLDVYFFRPYKHFVKFITDSIVLEDWNIWHRDNFIRIQSFTHFQFTAPRFRNLIRYAFYKAGYLSECPPKCETPINYCFKELGNYCSKEGCRGIAFVRCAHCECSLCMEHTLKDVHIGCQ